MSSPLQFYRNFRTLLQEHGIRHVLTSGMACVEYGIQQTTKDTDWILECADIARFQDVLAGMEQAAPPWKCRLRHLFGAPLEAQYLSGGWTCHLAIHDEPDSPEHHIDLFGHPPRLSEEDWCHDYGGLLNRPALAQMKKTDRAKDWPFVNGLAIQAMEDGDFRGWLHLREPAVLHEKFGTIPPNVLEDLAVIRPLLRQIPDLCDEISLERLLHVEEMIWQSVNRERYQVFQKAWKDFFRRWKDSEPGAWPFDEAFGCQLGRVSEAARRYELPVSPLGTEPSRQAVYESGVARARKLASASEDEIDQVCPPIAHILP